MRRLYDLLIIDDKLDDLELCARAIDRFNHTNQKKVTIRVRKASTAHQGLEMIHANKPDCVLLDYSLPGVDGIDLLRNIRQQDIFVPVAFLTGQGDEQLAVELLQSGAQDYIVKSAAMALQLAERILDIIESYASDTATHKGQRIDATRVLIIDDNEDDRELICRSLRKAKHTTYQLQEASSGNQVLLTIKHFNPHCILLDYSLPGDDGLTVLTRIHSLYPYMPVILFSGLGNENVAAESIKMGAFSYLVKHRIEPAKIEQTVNQAVKQSLFKQQVDEQNQKIQQHQQQSNEQKKRYDRVIEASGLIVWEYDLTCDRFYVSDQLNVVLGADESFSCSKDWLSRLSPEDQQKTNICSEAAKQTNDYRKCLTYRVRHQSGGWYWIREISDVSRRDSAGRPTHFSGLFEDVNERINEEQMLNEFYSLTVTADLSFTDKVSQVLTLALSYFHMEQGIVSRIDQNQHNIIYRMPATKAEKIRQQPLADTYCAHVFASDAVHSWHNVSGSELHAQRCYQIQQQECYIGTSLYVDGVPFGTLYFINKTARSRPFTNREHIFLRLIAQWLAQELSREKILSRLQESQEFLQLIQDSIPDILYVLDEHSTVVRANPDFLSLYPETARDSIVGEKFINPFHVTNNAPFDEKQADIEQTIHYANGRQKTVITRKASFKDREQKNYTLYLSRDITTIKEARRKLAESEERFALAVKGSSVGIWDWNVQTDELFWSAQFMNIVGLPAQNSRPSYDEFSSRLHPDDKVDTEQALLGHVANGTPYDVEYRLRHEDGHYVWIHARGQAVWDAESGQATRMAGSVEDITSSKMTQQSLLKSNRELERFAYMASHDLQEPLRMVANFTGLLRQHCAAQLDDRAQQYINYACEGATRMQALVSGLLAYARIANAAVKYQSVDLNQLREQVEANLLVSIKQEQATIHWQALPTVSAEPATMLSVLQNLIGNAIKYRQVDVPPVITISAEEEEKYWTVAIADNGIGIKPDYCEKIFEPFKRLHRREDYAGVGMGLAICRKTIEELGGRIWAVSTLGEGSTFYFKLPKIKHEILTRIPNVKKVSQTH